MKRNALATKRKQEARAKLRGILTMLDSVEREVARVDRLVASYAELSDADIPSLGDSNVENDGLGFLPMLRDAVRDYGEEWL